MRVVRLAAPDDFEGWRAAARNLALAGIAPDAVRWQVDDAAARETSDPAPPLPEPPPGAELKVSRRFLDLARAAALHRDPARFSRLYALLLRLQARPELIADPTDPELAALESMARAVQRDLHRMRAEIRFRAVEEDAGERLIARFAPEHHVVRHNTGFFLDRMAGQRWSILTPDLSLHWDGETLTEGPGAAPEDGPRDDEGREKAAMPEHTGNADDTLAALRAEAVSCRRCPLWKPATQMVFGEGPADAALMFVGEQPGDQEDLQGRPFVGPAGQLLDRALAAAGIDRSRIYITNSVKHFKFTPRGGRRIHQKPDVAEIEACRWWVEQETMIVNPKLTVMLGATAARALLGRQVTIGRERGRALELPGGGTGWVTVHPSFLLRIDDARRANEEKRRFLADLKGAAALAGLAD